MGIDSVEYDKFQYQALLETMSYFWASKGGRGSLLEKIIAHLGNSYSMSGITLFKIFSTLSAKNNENKSLKYEKGLEWLSKTNIKKIKFDLVNIIGDRLIILELKNRVDSGGTAAREEALSKKFFAISKAIESEDKILRYQGEDYNFAKILSSLGINKTEMIRHLMYLKENDKQFDEMFTKFCHDSADSKTLFNLINYIPNKESIPIPNTTLNSGQDTNSYLADCLYAFAAYIISKSHIIKSRKRNIETMSLNKGVLTET
jgi:hypothetical protein